MNVQTMTRHNLETHIVLPSKAANAGDFSEADLEKIAGGSAVSVARSPTVYVAVAVSALAGAIATTAGAGVSAAVTLDSGGW